jgi:hypothetical protein
MLVDRGDLPTGLTVPFMFPAYNADGAAVTISGLAVTDIEIYKGTSMTQRASDNGYALLDTDGIDIDSTTGLHGFSIDFTDNSDSGFYAAGSFYHLVVNAITVDGQTVIIVWAFSLGLTARPATAGRTLAVESDGMVYADAREWLGGTIATPSVTGVPEVDLTHHAGQAPATNPVHSAPQSDPPGVTTLLARLTSTRAGYLDNLSAGAVATAAALTSLANKFLGISLVRRWMQAGLREDFDDAATLAEINEDLGGGDGGYDPAFHSQEEIGDVAAQAADDAASAETLLNNLNDLDAQGVRDAMKLAPTAGSPDAGSVDEHLDTIEAQATAAASSAATAATQATTAATQSTTAATQSTAANVAAAAVKVVTDKLATMLATSGANWTFTVDALKNAPAGEGGSTSITVTVISSVVSGGEITEGRYTAYSGSPGVLVIPVVDQDGEAIALPADVIFCVERLRGRGTDLFVKENGEGLTIGGAESNVATVEFEGADVATPGTYLYSLRNTSDAAEDPDKVWAHGTFTVVKAAQQDAA